MSAKSAKSLAVELRPSGKSFIYIKNSSGPKTVPLWGTPDVATTGADDSPPPPQLPLIEYAVLETIRTSYVMGHQFRNNQVSSKVGDGELCRMLLKNRGLQRELFCWTG